MSVEGQFRPETKSSEKMKTYSKIRRLITLLDRWHSAIERNRDGTGGGRAVESAYRRVQQHALTLDTEGVEYAHGTMTVRLSGATLTIPCMGGSGFSEKFVSRFSTK